MKDQSRSRSRTLKPDQARLEQDTGAGRLVSNTGDPGEASTPGSGSSAGARGSRSAGGVTTRQQSRRSKEGKQLLGETSGTETAGTVGQQSPMTTPRSTLAARVTAFSVGQAQIVKENVTPDEQTVVDQGGEVGYSGRKEPVPEPPPMPPLMPRVVALVPSPLAQEEKMVPLLHKEDDPLKEKAWRRGGGHIQRE